MNKKRFDAFKKYVSTLHKKNTFSRQLNKDTKTVDLLDDFCSSGKDFLLLRNQFYLNSYYYTASLIITRKYNEFDYDKTQPTMTELKQAAGKSISKVSTYRLLPLINKIKEIKKEIIDLDEEQIIIFEKPFLIGGQTSNNRTGYGSEWSYGVYFEGTLYGEVTDFMVVGIKIGNKYSK